MEDTTTLHLHLLGQWSCPQPCNIVKACQPRHNNKILKFHLLRGNVIHLAHYYFRAFDQLSDLYQKEGQGFPEVLQICLHSVDSILKFLKLFPLTARSAGPCRDHRSEGGQRFLGCCHVKQQWPSGYDLEGGKHNEPLSYDIPNLAQDEASIYPEINHMLVAGISQCSTIAWAYSSAQNWHQHTNTFTWLAANQPTTVDLVGSYYGVCVLSYLFTIWRDINNSMGVLVCKREGFLWMVLIQQDEDDFIHTAHFNIWIHNHTSLHAISHVIRRRRAWNVREPQYFMPSQHFCFSH